MGGEASQGQGAKDGQKEMRGPRQQLAAGNRNRSHEPPRNQGKGKQ